MKELHLKKEPFMKSNDTTSKIMIRLFIALLPIIIFAFYKNGIIPYLNHDTNFYGMMYPLIFIFAGALTTFLTETIYSFLFLKKRGKDLLKYIKNSYSVFPGLFLALILPMNTPMDLLIFGGVIATVIGKMLFGGFGYNVFNPALVGRLFIISAYASTIMSNGGYLNLSEVDAVTKATPLSNIVDGIGSYATLVKPYGSLTNFFVGTIPGAMGEVSALLCLVAFIYLSLTKTIKWKIPTFYVLTVFLMTYLIGGLNGLGIWYPLFQILSGGLMFGAIFMATDPVTSPTTNFGQIIYGIGLGLLTVIFRYLTPYPEGVLTSILTMNMLVFIIDKIGSKKDVRRNILIILALTLLMGITSYNISKKYTVSETDSNFNIISKEISGNKITYVVTQKGYSSNIKAKIVIDKTIKSIEILDQNDSFFAKVEDSKYIDKIIKEQNSLSDIDTVSGATISSTALKKMAINTLNDYKNGSKEEIKNEEKPQRKQVSILNKEEVNNNIIYTVETKSFGGYMTLEITTNKNKITKIEIIDSKDTYLSKLEEDKFLDKIIEDEDIDTVSGATISSTAIKRAVSLVMEDLNEKEN